MSRTMLDDRSFIESTTPQLPMSPTRLEPTQAEREAAQLADRASLSEVCRVFGWTVAHVDEAIAAFGFPKPAGRGVGVRKTSEPFYRKHEIRDWHARFSTFARTVPTKVF